MPESTKKYTAGELTVLWKPKLCTHSAKCAKGLPKVFDPDRRPWVDLSQAEAEVIMAQVRKCPSGALSVEGEKPTEPTEVSVKMLPDGPLFVNGPISLAYADGSREEKTGVTAFCRCGASENKPFCDGSHKKIGFSG